MQRKGSVRSHVLCTVGTALFRRIGVGAALGQTLDAMVTAPTVRASLQPYVPRLTLQWLDAEPDQLHREVQASMVFVDISGFTKLSEKLAKLGKLGAEEIAASIDSCFAQLLEVAYRDDGSLLKFGGDALLLLFTGDEPAEHAERACRAAAGMRQRLREIGRLDTAGGRVTLRMSVGVHTGAYQMFLVGGRIGS